MQVVYTPSCPFQFWRKVCSRGGREAEQNTWKWSVSFSIDFRTNLSRNQRILQKFRQNRSVEYIEDSKKPQQCPSTFRDNDFMRTTITDQSHKKSNWELTNESDHWEDKRPKTVEKEPKSSKRMKFYTERYLSNSIDETTRKRQQELNKIENNSEKNNRLSPFRSQKTLELHKWNLPKPNFRPKTSKNLWKTREKSSRTIRMCEKLNWEYLLPNRFKPVPKVVIKMKYV